MRLQTALVVALVVLGGCAHKPAKTEAEAPKAASAPAAKETGLKASMDTAKVSAGSSNRVECKLKSDARVIEARSKDKGCELAYTKGGSEKIVASSTHGTTFCEGRLTKLVDKLKSSKYECN